MIRLLINARETEKRMLLEKDNYLQSVYIEQPEQESLVGNIYLGYVEKLMHSMDAAFVNIGKGKKGYLHLSQLPGISNVHQGEKILVQVIKDETDTKYYRLTRNIELSSDTLVYMPYGQYVAISKKLPEQVRDQLRQWANEVKVEPEGILLRTQAGDVTQEELVEKLTYLRNEFQRLIKLSQNLKAPALLVEKNTFFEEIKKINQKEKVSEIICDDYDLFHLLKEKLGNITQLTYYKEKENIISHFLLEKEMETLHKKIVWLKNGANIVIEENEAFTIIDVNTAKSPGHKLKRDAVMTTNTLAAKEIARQVRLRNIGGNILIDFINMQEEKERIKIINLLKQEFAQDFERIIIYGFTALGILEMSRKRTKPSIRQKMMIPCPNCHGTGFIESPATVAFRLERELWEYRDQDFSEVVIAATEDVIQYFTGDHQNHLKDLESTLHFSIHLQPENFAIPHYHIKKFVR